MIWGFQVIDGLGADCPSIFFSSDDIVFVSRWLERNEAVDKALFKMILSIRGGFQNPLVQTKAYF